MAYPKRKNLRLRGFDYTQNGAYYITICTYGRSPTLSRIRDGGSAGRAVVELTDLGEIAENTLIQMAERYGIELAAWTIMPNHIHFIMVLESAEKPQEISAGRFVGAYKSVVSNRWQKKCDQCGVVMGKIWQRDFYDHIIRNDADYQEKLKYIDENPDKWSEDELL